MLRKNGSRRPESSAIDTAVPPGSTAELDAPAARTYPSSGATSTSVRPSTSPCRGRDVSSRLRGPSRRLQPIPASSRPPVSLSVTRDHQVWRARCVARCVERCAPWVRGTERSLLPCSANPVETRSAPQLVDDLVKALSRDELHGIEGDVAVLADLEAGTMLVGGAAPRLPRGRIAPAWCGRPPPAWAGPSTRHGGPARPARPRKRPPSRRGRSRRDRQSPTTPSCGGPAWRAARLIAGLFFNLFNLGEGRELA